ncbi:hypothetical protein AXK11_04900 [Cephaloticoccus primus]|uniref:Prepilin-type N-terminal cleavage/methylation domain-containing protein n=2 Tax=Cephaloticoccus primus TaxID=1548207 RepID=A0A139SMP3_9BACT|nr:prepilin-type N-terminal cleavage/methylation domain-containing protein [Cephaloticoccus primus]KXU35876.1 hypothetical protein AXK11_04900 [Cephaloticoccus primus]
MRARRAAGFTLIELLVVIAIIGILAAILIPTASGVRSSAQRARTRVQFAQWAAAIEAFRREYGHYPQFDPSHKVNGGASASGEHLFHDILAGRRRDGQPIAGLALAQNRRRMAFHSFGQTELGGGTQPALALICDAQGNTDIAVLVDRNLDGRIDAADYPVLPSVSREGALIGAPAIPPSGLSLPVAFYSAAANATVAAPEFVVSW